MIAREIFKIWAPSEAKWTEWVRPVPFIALDKHTKTNEFYDWSIPTINYISENTKDTAIIIDIPGYESIKEGIALTKLGFRPIPIYNGTNEQEGAISTVNNHIIEPALIWGAEELQKIKIENDAPPTFLLDSNRMHRHKMNLSVFDNSWDIYHQDLPSAHYFKNNKIKKIIVRGEKIQNDLKKILYQFQKENIQIMFTNGFESPKEVKIKKQKEKEI